MQKETTEQNGPKAPAADRSASPPLQGTGGPGRNDQKGADLASIIRELGEDALREEAASQQRALEEQWRHLR